jgi:hypothetical protein
VDHHTLDPMPDYPWPDPPSESAISEPTERLERYKAELAAHGAYIAHQTAQGAAASEREHALAELLLKARIDRETAAAARQDALAQHANAVQTMQLEFRHSMLTELHKAYIEAAKASVDRLQRRAELLQGAAVAIGTLYTGMFGYFFITADADAATQITDRLETRGIIPVVFLGATIMLAMASIAFRTPPGKGGAATNPAEVLPYVESERNRFVGWVTHASWWQILLNQLSVVSLGFAVATLPIAFITDLDNSTAFERTAQALFAVLFVWGVGWFFYWVEHVGRGVGSGPPEE